MENIRSNNLIVIEGGDGTGKTDQVELLMARLKQEGHKAVGVDFPRYGDPPHGNPTSFFVRKYLQKKEFGFSQGYGQASQINPYAVSLGYALDRFDAAYDQETRPNLWDYLNQGYIVVSNRYTQSNIGYQASKISDPAERAIFIKWLIDLEYNKLGIPQPGLIILLDLEPSLAIEMKARQRKEQGQSLDAHERDSSILTKARNAYLETAVLFRDTWAVIEVAEKVHPATDILAGVRSRLVIHEKVWVKVGKFLNRE